MKVSKLVQRGVITCRIHDTLERAAQLMWDHDIGCVVVVDDDGHVAGMLTDRDVCMAAYTRGAPLAAIPVTVAMSTDVKTCTADDDLQHVEQTMGQHQIRRIP